MKVSNIKSNMEVTMSKQTKTKPEATETKAPEVIKLAELSRELDKNPKAVRARFRKLYAADDTSELPQPVKGGSRWTFAAKDREALVSLIGTEEA